MTELTVGRIVFTPGPWRDCEAPSNFLKGKRFIRPANGETCIAVIGSEMKAQERYANARLIAAAPDLLAALKAARNELAASAEASHFTDGFTIGADGLPSKRVMPATEADRLLQTVDAAIRKAEGR